ncbi:MAG: EAL domain-containing protein [Saccharospirillum sp.]|uniref:EAL domain-containing protein n=1 Tax=Saccharospirillum sp. TaxID=2033801 RepID=UPI003298058D
MSLENRPLLLVIEDEPAISQLICHALNKQGFETRVATSGEVGLDIHHDHQPDLVLLDVNLPGIDGFEVCAAIREARADRTTPIIMLTGADDVASISHAFELGATDFLTKPINLPLLVQRVRYALRNRDNELTLRKSLHFQSRASQFARMGYLGYHFGTQTFLLNALSKSLLHLEDGEYAQHKILDLLHPEDRIRMEVVLSEKREADLELRVNLPEAGQRIIRFSCSMEDADGLVMHGAFQDITEHRSTDDLLTYLRLHDDMTGLPNERMLLQQVGEHLQSMKSGGPLSILAQVSLSGYGRQVSVFGQKRVNELIKHIANDFKRYLRPLQGQVEIFYINEGRFSVLGRFKTEQAMEEHLSALVQLSETDRHIDNEILTPNSLCSAMTLTKADLSADYHYQRSRLGLHQAESNPGKGVYWLEDSEPDEIRREMHLESEVKRALQAGQFDLYLQPQLSIDGHETVCGFEALVRWIDDNGQISHHSPAEFLPAIERMGLMVQLGKLIIELAFKKARALKEAGLTVRLGINLAAQQFADDQLVPFILSTLNNSGLNAEDFEFEITEGTAMADPHATLLKLKALRQAGFHLAIDDFGIGYSSMEYLLQFPLTTLKIDRAFIIDITLNPKVRAIIQAMVTLARGLNLTTVAEGIESVRQRDYLDALGIDLQQGFYYAKALPLEEAIAFAQSRKSRTVSI